MVEHASILGKNKETSQLKQTKQSARPNSTGIPDGMKERFENISGFSFDDVKVHYNSNKPSGLGALAYSQQNAIYVAPGQEMHLGHELGHIIQQKRGQVVPTEYIMGVAVNSDPLLEKEADSLCSKALSHPYTPNVQLTYKQNQSNSTQFLLDRIKRGEKAATGQKITSSLRSTTVLSAELDGVDLGLFKSYGGKHAEDTLIAYLKGRKIKSGKLKINLSTSPCSSTFGTSKKEEGCQEELEALGGTFDIEVIADHPYQPKGIADAKSKSIEAAESSSISISFSKGVAQLKNWYINKFINRNQ